MNTQLCPTVCFLGEGEGENQSPPDLSPSPCSLGRPGCGVSTWPNNGAGGGARLILSSTALQRPRCGKVLTGRVLQLSQMPGAPTLLRSPQEAGSVGRVLLRQGVARVPEGHVGTECLCPARPGYTSPPYLGGTVIQPSGGGCLVPRLVSMGAAQGWAGRCEAEGGGTWRRLLGREV